MANSLFCMSCLVSTRCAQILDDDIIEIINGIGVCMNYKRHKDVYIYIF